jgi:hypothetical protein
MGGSVRTLGAQQIEDVAAYYASLKGIGAARTERAAGPNAAAMAAAATAGAEAASLTAGQAGAPVAAASGRDTLAGCPVDNPSIPVTQDSDRDGLPDRYDGAPADASEFARDSDGDGWLEICDVRQLQAIQTLGEGPGNATGLDWAARVARKYRLVRDLDASVIDNFASIGNCGPQNNCMLVRDQFGFTGAFDGGGHVIRKLRISRPEIGGVGLFGAVAKQGSIRGVRLENAEVTGLHGVGALVGANFGVISDSSGSVRITGKNATGGLIGAHAGKIIHCEASGEVNGNDAIGGLVGDMRGFVARSHASTKVSGHNGVGGLVGLNTFSTLVSSYSTGSVKGNNNVGGLAGINTNAVVEESYSTASVDSTGTNAGGLVAFNSESRIRNSYARGDVRGVNSVGGLVGTNNGRIRASYTTGSVDGKSKVGGLVGDNSGGTISASYWDTKGTGRLFGAGNDDGNDDNKLDSGEVSQFAAYGKNPLALRTLKGPTTGWLPDGNSSEPADTFYCDANVDGAISEDEQRPDNVAWEFGTDAENPGLRCIDGGPAGQPLR